jgi:gluconate 2-dehydrogenase gamma chain
MSPHEEERRMAGREIDRRQFGKILGAASVGGALAPTSASSQEPAAETTSQHRDGFTFFTPAEAAFVEAAIDHLIPPDELGPGAREAGVAVFIDRQLSGAYGTAAKWYMQGPWGDSVPEQGYQRPLTPQDLYRLCIREINELCDNRYEERFDLATPEQQLAILEEMERGELSLSGVPIREFFTMLLQNTMEGFFADPIHGGNRDKVGWRLVGFPGVGAAYRTHVQRFNEPYLVEPVSIEDVLNRRARLDEHGHVEHEPLSAKRRG